jgi:hypothetical protein
MARLTELSEVLFPVRMEPLFVRLEGRDVRVPDSQAVVHAQAGRVLGVVGREYRLVSHREALDLAMACAHEAFPETRPGEWQVAAVDAPATGSSCFIDLRHSTGVLDFQGLPGSAKPEVYGPFVRVTNSYNRSRALAFDIGYWRKVCSNGLVARDVLIRFRLNHQRRDIGAAVRFDISRERLAGHCAAFQALLSKLQGCHVPARAMTDLACAVLGFEPPRHADDARNAPLQAEWQRLHGVVDEANWRYAGELGENAYAVLNAVTELASRPPSSPLVRRDRHGLQRRAGRWLADFAATCTAQGFDLGAYLQSLAAEAQGADGAGARDVRRLREATA